MNAIKLCSTLNLPRSEWIERRRSGIGGSDAAAVLGLNPYCGPFDVYADKLELVEPREETEPMRFGRDMEDYVAHRFTEATGKQVRRRNMMLRHPEHEWMLANLDRVVVGENAILECKTTSDMIRWKLDEGECDPAHHVQCMHYLAVTGYERAYLAVYQRKSGLHVFEITRNDADIALLIEVEGEFWREHILTGIPPDPDGSDAAGAVIKKMFPCVEREKTFLNGKEKLLADRTTLAEQIAALEKEKAKIDQAIQLEMGTAEIGTCNGWRVSWPNINGRSTVDSKALKREHPDIYLKYAKTGKPYRRFVVEKVEEEGIAL